MNPLTPSEEQQPALKPSLLSWQTRLEDHFSKIHKERTATFGNQPVFALEHGLTELEFAELSTLVRAHVIQAQPSDRHWLVWVVYATEVGYEYSGEEYWQTFEDETPRWIMRGDRGWLRECFWRFCKAYGGAKPTGAWARHFSIICWPITHAILPKDLQRQLAEILYQIRHSFRRELFDSPELLGNEIAARSWMASSRFQLLTKEPLLLGQIAAALLIGEKDPAKSLIAPDTLLRIAKNLDRERGSRAWLKDARAAAKAKLTGVAAILARPPEVESVTPRQQLQALGIEPRVYLRATPSSSWEVVLEIPDLAPLLSRFPSLEEPLNGSCVVTGSSGRPLSRGRLLHYGPQLVVLRRWPSATDILLKFEIRPLELEFLLRTECMLRPGPNWLFKISADGVAREIRTQIIRPGNKYVLLTVDKVASEEEFPRARLECEGVSAAYLDVPPVLSEQELKHFVDLGLQAAKQVDVRPAGLPPINWDGEGQAQWLSTDHPSICISSDHPIQALTLNLEGPVATRLDLVPNDPGERLFVEMEDLPPGSHTLHVFVQSSGDQILMGDLEITVRDPRPWRPVLTDQNALSVITDQPNPSLEQLWEGKVAVQIQGPSSREAHCDLLFSYDELGRTVAFQKELPNFVLPLQADTWRRYFDANVRSDETLEDAYDRASYCELHFSAEELGQFTLICRREFSPLRWLIRWENHGYVLRLRDDTGDPKRLRFSRYEFEKPDLPIPLDAAVRDQPLRIPDAGGLFSAQSSECNCGIVVPPLLLHSLSALRVDPSLQERPRNAQTVTELVSLYAVWSEARITGGRISFERRNDVVEAFMKNILKYTCGSDWLAHELRFKEVKNCLPDLKSAISRKAARAGFGAAIWLKHSELAERSVADRVATLSQLAGSYLELPGFVGFPSQSKDLYQWTAEFVLRLMTKPERLPQWAGDQMNAGLGYVLECPTLARGARFLGLAIAWNIPSPSPRPGLINLPNWEWQ